MKIWHTYYTNQLSKHLKEEKCIRFLFKGNIWAPDLADIGLLSSRNEGVYSLYVMDVFTKYDWVKKPLTDKKAKTVLNGFIKTLYACRCKPK